MSERIEDLGSRVSAARADVEARGETFYPGPSRVHLAAFPPKERWDDWVELDSRAWPQRRERRSVLVPTTCFNCESACGLLAYVDPETLEVRKFEGNPEHPGSLGATDLYAQGSVLTLYDPDRSQSLVQLGEIRPWNTFITAMKSALDYYTNAFGPYQFRELRVVEIPPYALSGGRAMATTIAFAEPNFITRNDEGRGGVVCQPADARHERGIARRPKTGIAPDSIDPAKRQTPRVQEPGCHHVVERVARCPVVIEVGRREAIRNLPDERRQQDPRQHQTGGSTGGIRCGSQLRPWRGSSGNG